MIYHVLLYECTNKIVQEDNNNAIIVKTSLFQGFSFECLSKTNVHVAICTNILRAKMGTWKQAGCIYTAEVLKQVFRVSLLLNGSKQSVK